METESEVVPTSGVTSRALPLHPAVESRDAGNRLGRSNNCHRIAEHLVGHQDTRRQRPIFSCDNALSREKAHRTVNLGSAAGPRILACFPEVTSDPGRRSNTARNRAVGVELNIGRRNRLSGRSCRRLFTGRCVATTTARHARPSNPRDGQDARGGARQRETG
jgi:hypothetical protein